CARGLYWGDLPEYFEFW
nr:immunoglobulin heavy chain junction region [Macaca mulatta]MOV88601.1 immunoglobulin heavy chain junction region [Macaca mulatta]MOV88610.1 immunoglobulin heavy chain junction region [Macaca mulatta]MOV88621.1 immunoglobulin heavy chain junction region [Macaca mulatta]MOV88624.1 immunoglobulin heavy chain junction region [Macaca mulatta]